MTTTAEPAALSRRVYFHDPTAPAATVVVPSAFVAARGRGGRLLLVRRIDSGCWELPGGKVDVGESAEQAAVRETAEETGLTVLLTGLVGVFTDPGYVVRAADGQIRQQFSVMFRARAVGGRLSGDGHETSEAAWVALADIPGLPVEPPIRMWITEALCADEPPRLG
jgi:ADP-ribose pyrophosphatase YjhB (NUDIX family)